MVGQGYLPSNNLRQRMRLASQCTSSMAAAGVVACARNRTVFGSPLTSIQIDRMFLSLSRFARFH
jgi:hypothetical protein